MKLIFEFWIYFSELSDFFHVRKKHNEGFKVFSTYLIFWPHKLYHKLENEKLPKLGIVTGYSMVFICFALVTKRMYICFCVRAWDRVYEYVHYRSCFEWKMRFSLLKCSLFAWQKFIQFGEKFTLLMSFLIFVKRRVENIAKSCSIQFTLTETQTTKVTKSKRISFSVWNMVDQPLHQRQGFGRQEIKRELDIDSSWALVMNGGERTKQCFQLR